MLVNISTRLCFALPGLREDCLTYSRFIHRAASLFVLLVLVCKIANSQVKFTFTQVLLPLVLSLVLPLVLEAAMLLMFPLLQGD